MTYSLGKVVARGAANSAQEETLDRTTLEIPIFPLNTVLYPGGRLPLRIFETRYVDMTKACIRDNAVFGVCQIREGRESGAPAVPFETGCTARIIEWEVPHAGLFSLVTEGETVFRIMERWTTPSGLILAQVQLQEPLPPLALPSHYQPLGQLLGNIIHHLGPSHFPEPLKLDDSAWVCHRLAELLPLDVAQKQRLLEARDPEDLLREIEEAVKSIRTEA